MEHIKHLSAEGFWNNRPSVALGYVAKQGEIVHPFEGYVHQLQVGATRLEALSFMIGCLGMCHSAEIKFGVRCRVYFNTREGIGYSVVLPLYMA
jgi:hypothetical protein